MTSPNEYSPQSLVTGDTRQKKPKCRVNWNKPTRAGTICNYVDEITNECSQNDWISCPCGGIVRYPRFDDMPWNERERNELRSRPVAASQPTPEHPEIENRFSTKYEAWAAGYQDGQSSVTDDLNIRDAAIRNEVLDEVYNKIDGKRVCKWGESERCEVLDLVESFRTISTTGDKGGE